MSYVHYVPVTSLLTNRPRHFAPGLDSDAGFDPVADSPLLLSARHILDLVRPQANEYGLYRLLLPMLGHDVVRQRLSRHLAAMSPIAFSSPRDVFVNGTLGYDTHLNKFPGVDRVPTENPVNFEIKLRREADGVAVLTYGTHRRFVDIEEQRPGAVVRVNWPDESGVSGLLHVDDFDAWQAGTLTFTINHVPRQFAYARWLDGAIQQTEWIDGKSVRPLQTICRQEGLIDELNDAVEFGDKLAIIGLALALQTWRRLPDAVRAA